MNNHRMYSGMLCDATLQNNRHYPDTVLFNLSSRRVLLRNLYFSRNNDRSNAYFGGNTAIITHFRHNILFYRYFKHIFTFGKMMRLLFESTAKVYFRYIFRKTKTSEKTKAETVEAAD